MSPSRLLPLVALLAAAACGSDKLIDRPADPPQTDSFAQLKASSIDILFVIDNSGSMKPHQEALAANFSRFMDLIDPDPSAKGEDGEVDYRLAIATTDVDEQAGQLQGEPKILQPGQNYDPIAAFKRNVIVGTKGAAREQGLRAAELALQGAAQLKDANGKKAFMRDDAFLYVIFVADEDDNSFGEVRYYHRRLESLKGIGNENTVLTSVITGIDRKGCKIGEDIHVEYGSRYVELTQLTGGVLGNLCTDDWSATLRELAFSGLGLRKRFQLSMPVEPRNADRVVTPESFDYIAVHYPCTTSNDDPHLTEHLCSHVERHCGSGADKPGVACTPYWSEEDGVIFDPRENTLVFSGAAIPGPGSTIWATYQARIK
ncbi:MAG TPA: hypothetical protein VGD74_05605 [Vulgatibacter sp.]